MRKGRATFPCRSFPTLAVMKSFAARAASIAVIALFASPQVIACHRIYPQPDSPEQYSAIFVGTVTGIHLASYEKHLLGQQDFVDPHLGGVTIVDGSGQVVVDAVVLNTIRGAPPRSLSVSLVGCTAPLPELKQSGLFFLSLDGTSAVTVWDSEESFLALLSTLSETIDDR